MKKLIFPLLMLVLSSCSERTGRTVKVLDGDTIIVQDFTGIHTLRLAEIDCPEKTQARGIEAKNFTQALCGSQQVSYKIIDEDRYGRKIAKIYVCGRYLSEELVKNGFAWVYRRYTDDKNLISEENQAKLAKRGIWADYGVQNPQDYRITHD